MGINFKANSPRLKYLGEFTFLLLGALAYWFYLERTIILDVSFQGLMIIYKNSLAIQFYRFGAAFTQAFPLIAVRLGLPLEWVLKLYSLAFVVFPFLLYLFLARLAGNHKMGLVLVLFYTLLVSHTFFWIQSELLQACALLILFFGLWMKKPPVSFWSLPLWMAGLFLILMTHLLAFIPLMFIWLFMWMDERFPKRQPFYSLIPASIIILLLRSFVFSNQHDDGAIRLAKNVVTKFGQIFIWPSTIEFVQNLFTDYFYLPILMFFIVRHYHKQKEPKKLWLVVGFILVTLLLTNGSYWKGGAAFHLESYYQLLSIFLAFPLVFDLWDQQPYKKWFPLVLPLMVVIKLTQMTLFTSPFYVNRIKTNQALLEKVAPLDGSKFLAHKDWMPREKLLQTWSTPCETLLLSALNGPDSLRTIIVANPDDKPVFDHIQRTDQFLTYFGPISYEKLNSSPYFNFTDTTEYRILKKEDIQIRLD